jgi:hypothetical protein
MAGIRHLPRPLFAQLEHLEERTRPPRPADGGPGNPVDEVR